MHCSFWRSRLVVSNHDDDSDTKDEDGEIVETAREEGEVSNTGLEDETELRRELGEEWKDRVEDTRCGSAVLTNCKVKVSSQGLRSRRTRRVAHPEEEDSRRL